MLDCLRIDREQTDSTVSPLRLLLQLVSFPGDRIIIRLFNETPCFTGEFNRCYIFRSTAQLADR